MNRSNSMNTSQSQGISSSRTSSGVSNTDNAPSNEEAARGSEVGEPLDERDDNQTSSGDAMRERESQSDAKTIQSQSPLPSHGRASSGDSERVRVADIVRRLTSGSDDCIEHEQGNCLNESPTRERKQSGSDQAEQRCGLQVITTVARIRGRQAFADLLMQIERDRNRELEALAGRQAVSRFSQRGRLQAMLRLRCLERCLAIQDRHRSKMTAADVNRLQQGSVAMNWREKVRMNVEQNTAAQPDARAPNIGNLNKAVESKNSSDVSQHDEASHGNGAFAGQSSPIPPDKTMSNTSKEQAKPTISEEQAMSSTIKEQVQAMSRISEEQAMSSPIEQEEQALSRISEDHQEAASQTCSEVSYSHSQVIAETAFSEDWLESERAEEEEVTNQQHLNGWDANETEEDEEEDDDDQHYYVDNNYDWYTDISRPRSYWEELRQTWYQEVLNTSSENQEIRQLLERRTVSTFLGSDMRERMDRLMISRIQIQSDMGANQEEDSVEEEAQERANQWMLSYLQRDRQATHREEEEEGRHDVEVEPEEEERQQQQEEGRPQEEEDDNDDDDDDEGEQEESLFSHQYHEASSDYFSQSSSQLFPSSPMRSWTYRDQEVSDYPDQVTSESQLTQSQPHPYPDNDQPSSFTVNQPSTEMELVHDLRGHMQQLQREMSELRDSIKCCIEMQLKLQQCINQEIFSGDLVRGDEKKNSVDKSLVRRNCCICFEMKVDSLLYRCGHMCTCLKCAHELQWSSGKCPICRAPIMDVVRAFVDS